MELFAAITGAKKDLSRITSHHEPKPQREPSNSQSNGEDDCSPADDLQSTLSAAPPTAAWPTESSEAYGGRLASSEATITLPSVDTVSKLCRHDVVSRPPSSSVSSSSVSSHSGEQQMRRECTPSEGARSETRALPIDIPVLKLRAGPPVIRESPCLLPSAAASRRDACLGGGAGGGAGGGVGGGGRGETSRVGSTHSPRRPRCCVGSSGGCGLCEETAAGRAPSRALPSDLPSDLPSEIEDEIIFDLNLGSISPPYSPLSGRPPLRRVAGLNGREHNSWGFHWEAIACDQSPWGRRRGADSDDDAMCTASEGAGGALMRGGPLMQGGARIQTLADPLEIFA